MERAHRVLLIVDGVANLLLGVILLVFPVGLVETLGLPETTTFFYANMLGAVIFGIGIAIFVELLGASAGARGLGLGGAIAINLCCGGALTAWLLFRTPNVPLRGAVVLWVVAIIVLGIGIVELIARTRHHEP